MKGSRRFQILAGVGLAAALAGAAVGQPSRNEAPFSCESDNGPPDTYVGWIDKRTGVFLFHCRVFADRDGVAFRMTYRSPPAAKARRAGAIGGSWGVGFDDLVQTDAQGRVVIRNGADGSVDTYGPTRRDKPMLVAGGAPDQRERRAEGCEYVERAVGSGLRRVYCDRTIQHFEANGRLASYSTHAFRQIFTLDHADDALTAVSAYAPDGHPIITRFSRRDRRLVVSDQDGRAVTFDFDEAGRLASAAGPGGETYGFTYDAQARLATVTFPTGRTQRMTYDAKGRIAEIAAGDGGGARIVYGRRFTEIQERASDGTQGVSRLTF